MATVAKEDNFWCRWVGDSVRLGFPKKWVKVEVVEVYKWRGCGCDGVGSERGGESDNNSGELGRGWGFFWYTLLLSPTKELEHIVTTYTSSYSMILNQKSPFARCSISKAWDVKFEDVGGESKKMVGLGGQSEIWMDCSTTL